MGIADFGEALRHGEDREVSRIAIGHLVPMQRSRNACVRQRAYGVCGTCRPVLGILVVIEEHAVTLFLPPLRCGEVGRAALYGTRERNRGAAYLLKRPPRL